MATVKDAANAPTTEELSRQIDQLKNDIGALTKTISDLGKSTGSELSRQVRDQAKAARTVGEDQVAALQLQADVSPALVYIIQGVILLAVVIAYEVVARMERRLEQRQVARQLDVGSAREGAQA